jgi:hypothetical protein
MGFLRAWWRRGACVGRAGAVDVGVFGGDAVVDEAPAVIGPSHSPFEAT